jgi:hypothetical protein
MFLRYALRLSLLAVATPVMAANDVENQSATVPSAPSAGAPAPAERGAGKTTEEHASAPERDDVTGEVEGEREGERVDPSLPRLPLVRIDQPPTIDGVLDEAAWEEAARIEGFRQVEPNQGAPVSEPTVALLLYDRDFLYIGVRCYDGEPEKIVATQMRRDTGLGPDDRIAIVIDPYFSRRNGYYFETNPLGARGDALIEDNSEFNKSWDGIWYCQASIDEEGWTAEIALPFKTISFNPDTDRWSLNILRFIRRKNETARWASPSRDRNFNSFADAGVITNIRDIEQGLGLDVQPYIIGTLRRDHEGDETDLDFDAGFDLFYKITPSLTLSTTFNTDFAETEVDDRRINLTRFPLFFPEKRDFFLQDAGIFNFGGINRNPLPFHSRRIGIGPDGEEQDILLGAKLTGRVEDVNVGLLNVLMKDDDELGQKNFFVGRASVNVLEQSTVGAIFTHGDPGDTSTAWTGGVDFNYRTSDFLDGKTLQAHLWIQQSDSSSEETGGGGSYGGKVRYPNDRFNWSFGYTRIDDDFDAALGFVPRRGIHEYFANWRYRYRPNDDYIRALDFGVNGFLVTNLDGDVESRDLGFNLLTVRTEPGEVLDFDYSREREVLFDDFEISDGVVIPPGSYKFDRYRVRLSTSRALPIDGSFRFEGGEFFTGRREEYSLGLNWRPGPYFNMSTDYILNDVHLDEGDFLTRIIRARATVQFSPDLSWSTYAQYDNVSETIGINSKVRWIVKPGSEAFFVVNQGIEREDDSYTFTDTDITAKLGWTFRF